MRWFKNLFKKEDIRILANPSVKETLEPNPAREDGVYPAEFKHSNFIFEEIVKGSMGGSFHPAYISDEAAQKELGSQIADSIYHKRCGRFGGGTMMSVIFVIYQRGEVSGFCWNTSPLENTYEIYMMSVREQSKREGLGKKLVQTSLSSYPEGCKAIARVYENKYKTDRSNAMQKILIGEGFEKALKQQSTYTTQFEKIIS